jgi:hypothetical protein
MADEIQISPASIERTAKIRHPVAVPVLTVITLGIYGLYWWYQVNRELADLGRARGLEGLGDKPLYSLFAVFPGLLVIVPPYVSLYNGVGRIQKAQRATTGESSMNGWIVLLMVVGSLLVGFVGLLVPGYIQAELNKIWETVGSEGAVPAPAEA